MAKKMIPVMEVTPQVKSIMQQYQQALERATGHAVKVTAQPLPLLDKIGAVQWMKDVAATMLMTPEALLRRCRKRELVVIRQTAIYLLYQYSSLGVMGVGQSIGYDHTTVVHSIQTTADLLSVNDAQVTAVYQQLFNLITSYATKNNASTIGIYTPVDRPSGRPLKQRRTNEPAGLGDTPTLAPVTVQIGDILYQEITRPAPAKNPRLGTARHAGSMR